MGFSLPRLGLLPQHQGDSAQPNSAASALLRITMHFSELLKCLPIEFKWCGATENLDGDYDMVRFRPLADNIPYQPFKGS